MYIHIHIPSAWNHVEHVAKIKYPKSQQAKKQAANQKQSRIHKQTRGSIGQFTSKKEKTLATTGGRAAEQQKDTFLGCVFFSANTGFCLFVDFFMYTLFTAFLAV